MLNAYIGGIQFEGDPSSSNAFVIDPDGWSGWDEGTDVRRQEIVRPVGHGAFDVPGFLAPRVTTISGWIIASSPSALASMRQELTGLLADGSSATLTVETMAGTTTAVVRLAGQTAVTVNGGSETEARFQVTFWAPDPRRYGAIRTFGPGASVTGINHDGNFPATPVLTVAGSSGGGYTVTGPGSREITVTTALVPGDPHTIDLATGAFYVDGVRTLGGISVYEPWTVPAVGSVSASVSAGSLTVEVLDTFT